MVIRRTRVLLTVPALAATVVLAGCASVVDGSAASGSAPASTSAPASGSAPASTSTSTSTSASTSASTSSPSSVSLTGALLAPSDIGADWSGGPSSASSTGSPLPCTPTAPPLFTQVPPSSKAQGSYKNAAGTIATGETVAEFEGDSIATRAIAAGTKGFTCTSGSIGGETVKVVRRPGIPSTTGGTDQFAVWDFASVSTKGTAVLARLGRRVVGLVFTAEGSAGDTFPTGTVVDRALEKVSRLP